ADHLGINDSIKAVCFPTACAIASSFDRDLIQKMGEALGQECQAENVSVILGPAVNIKRSPLCGRNFEYFSEDPYLSSQMAKHHILGVQSQNVGTSLKHFAANNQEYRRMTSSSNMDERTLREIYLASFETAIKEANPWTVMSSYNKINDVYVGEDENLLTTILRNEWGFDGFVMSDWGAVNDRVKALKAGLDLEMPSSGVLTDQDIITAIKNKTLSEDVLNTTVERMLKVIFKYEDHRMPATFNYDAHHNLATRLEEECIVLLKNENLLPLSREKKVAIIGEFANKPRFQGGGSSHINAYKVTSALQALKGKAPFVYAQGYETSKDVIQEHLISEAVQVAKHSEVALLFVG
ncbi:MAG TPA: glycosyl hydrolase, partial [Firmicutes bacterium]|nr:glycosyl hydrolase [Bacillota bacterium]